MEYTVATFYHFADLPDFEAKQVPIKAFCDGQSVLGTIILAPEGINGTIAGPSAGITATLDFLRADERLAKLCQRLNHFNTQVCAEAERSFLNAMGGGCQSPVAAHAEVKNEIIHMPGISFGDGTAFSQGKVRGGLNEARALGQALAEQVKAGL